MKKLLFIVTLLSIASCADKANNIENPKLQAQLEEFVTLETTEENTKKFMNDYIRDMNSSDWTNKLPKYFQSNPEDFLEEHAAFRKSFPKYKAAIKHLMVDGNEGMVWIHVTANYAEQYSFGSGSEYGDDLLKGIKAKNQALSWDETWYFNLVDDRFGDKFDLLKDNYKVLKDLNALNTE